MLDFLLRRVKRFYTEWILPRAREHPITTLATGAGMFLFGLTVLGGHIVTTGIVAGTLLSGAFGVLFWRARHSENAYIKRAYRTMMHYPLAVDISLTLVAFIAAPTGITAWVAAGTCGVIMSCFLFSEHKLLELEEHNVQTLLHVDNRFAIVDKDTSCGLCG